MTTLDQVERLALELPEAERAQAREPFAGITPANFGMKMTESQRPSVAMPNLTPIQAAASSLEEFDAQIRQTSRPDEGHASPPRLARES